MRLWPGVSAPFAKGTALAFVVDLTEDPDWPHLVIGLHYRLDDFRWEKRGFSRTPNRVPAGLHDRGLGPAAAPLRLGDTLLVAWRMGESKDALLTMITVE